MSVLVSIVYNGKLIKLPYQKGKEIIYYKQELAKKIPKLGIERQQLLLNGILLSNQNTLESYYWTPSFHIYLTEKPDMLSLILECDSIGGYYSVPNDTTISNVIEYYYYIYPKQNMLLDEQELVVQCGNQILDHSKTLKELDIKSNSILQIIPKAQLEKEMNDKKEEMENKEVDRINKILESISVIKTSHNQMKDTYAQLLKDMNELKVISNQICEGNKEIDNQINELSESIQYHRQLRNQISENQETEGSASSSANNHS